jgi:hypothetical protein
MDVHTNISRVYGSRYEDAFGSAEMCLLLLDGQRISSSITMQQDALPLAQVPFYFRGHGPYRKTQRDDAGVVHQAVGFSSHINIARWVDSSFCEIDDTAQSDVVYSHLHLAVRVGLETYFGVEQSCLPLAADPMVADEKCEPPLPPPRCCLVRSHWCGDCWAYILMIATCYPASDFLFLAAPRLQTVRYSHSTVTVQCKYYDDLPTFGTITFKPPADLNV